MQKDERVFNVREERVPEVEAKFAKLAVRARKLGMPAPRAVVAGPPINAKEWVDTPLGRREVIRRLIPMRVEGAAPRVGDYKVVSVLDHSTSPPMIFTMPDEKPLPARFRTAGPTCEHCGLRRPRSKTIVVEGVSDGKLVQVGRACLQDFVRTDADVDAILAYAQFLKAAEEALEEEPEDGGGRSRRGEPYYKALGVLAATAAVVAKYGYKGRSREEEGGFPPTANLASALYTGWGTESEIALVRGLEITPRDERVAEKVRAWALSPALGSSEYAHNVRAALGAGEVKGRFFGIVASAVGAYLKFEEEARVVEQRKGAAHVGAVGDRVELDLAPRRHHVSQGFFNGRPTMTTIIGFEDAAKNSFVWFGSGYLIDDYPLGEVVHVKATVKEHKTNSYTRLPETVLSRVQKFTPPPPKAPKARKGKG